MYIVWIENKNLKKKKEKKKGTNVLIQLVKIDNNLNVLEEL